MYHSITIIISGEFNLNYDNEITIYEVRIKDGV